MKRLNAVRSKKELVIAEIREAILSGELAPGGRLVIEDLAGKLGVSTIPVREALQQLHADRYIVFEPFIGAGRTTPTASIAFLVCAKSGGLTGQSPLIPR